MVAPGGGCVVAPRTPRGGVWLLGGCMVSPGEGHA